MRVSIRRFRLADAMRAAACAAVLVVAGCSAASAPDVTASGGDVSLRLARAARASGDIATALPLYRKLAADPSADPQALVDAGDGLLEAGLPSEAVDAYTRAQARAARIGALLGLVRAHLALGEPEAALQIAGQAVAFAPQDARPLVDQGVALDTLQRHAEAQAAYRAALLITPGSVTARNDLALSLALSGRFGEAIALLEPLARAPSAAARTRQNLALIYGLSGDSARAASLSRMDLDAERTDANLAFFTRVRNTVPAKAVAAPGS